MRPNVRSVTHSAPSRPVATPAGLPPSSTDVIRPFVVIRQMRPRLPSGAHSAPSGPVVMSAGTANCAGSLNSLACACGWAEAVAGAITAASAATVAAAVRRRLSNIEHLEIGGAKGDWAAGETDRLLRDW